MKELIHEIFGVEPEHAYIKDNKLYVFLKYMPKDYKEKAQILKQKINKDVFVRTYSKYYWIYVDYKDKQMYVSSDMFRNRILELTGKELKKKKGLSIEGAMNIKDVYISRPKEVIIKGKVVHKQENVLYVNDTTETIKCYVNTLDAHIIENINVGEEVLIQGNYGSNAILLNKIQRIETKKKDIERIELNVKTKLSEATSVLDIEEYVKEASERGYKYIGISDIVSVQGFPILEKVSKKYNITPIYGATINVYNDDSLIINNLKEDFNLTEKTYTVFDLETTGTSPKYDEIIEIGAVKVENGMIIDSFHTMVKPRKQISKISTQITGITQDMVENAPYIEEVWPKFKEFIKGTVLVAHNADFDYSFINAIEEINMTYLDTLRLSRTVMNNRKRHGLASLAKTFKLGDFNHHRADEDAKVLAMIFMKLLERTFKLKIFTANELNEYGKQNEVDRKIIQVSVIVKTQEGLKNLYKMISDAHSKYLYHGIPAIPENKLKEYKKGLLYGTGLEGSTLYEEIYNNEFNDRNIDHYKELYDYIEIAPAKTSVNPETSKNIYKYEFELSKKMKKPIIAVSNAHYLDEYDRIVFKSLTQSNKSKSRNKEDIEAYFFRTDELIKEIQDIVNDKNVAMNIVLNGPKQLIEDIENIKIVNGILIPPGIENSDKQLKELTLRRLKEEYGDNPHKAILERVNKELNSIIKHGFAELYLLAQIVTKYSQDNGYIVGSRGSVGSSLVAHLIGVTEVNPMPAHYVCPKCKHTEFVDAPTGYDAEDKYCEKCNVKMDKRGLNIPFETFVGFEGDKVPDVDLNFSDEFQAKAHDYVRQVFGEDKVFRAGTILTIAEKTAFGIARDYASTNGKISDATVEYIAKRLQGVKVGTSQHPGGLLIVPKKYQVFDFTPYQHPANDTSQAFTTHIAYEHIHDDIVKLDALGHLNPTILKYLQEYTGVDPLTVPMDDKEVMKLFNSTDYDLEPISKIDSIGIPEFGTPFVRRILESTRPTTFDELVRIAGIAHGENIWNGNEEILVQSGVATLKEIITARDDIMNYLISKGVDKKLSFDIMERVRKGKGLRDEDIHEMKAHGVPEWYINACKKISYLFPKAHSAAYVMMSYRIAWFKRYYPAAFYSAILSKKSSVTFDYYMMDSKTLVDTIFKLLRTKNAKDKKDASILEIIFDAKQHNIEFELPNIYESEAEKFIVKNNKILLPLNTIKGLGTSVANNIVNERNKLQFMSVEDFKKRVKANKNHIAILQEIGAMEGLTSDAPTVFV